MTQYTMTAEGVGGGILDERVFAAPPTIDVVDAFGLETGAERVAVVGDGLVALYVPGVPGASGVPGEWWPLCSGVDEATADEMRLWDELIRLLPLDEVSDGHPLAQEPEPVAGTPVDAVEAVRLVTARILRDGLDYPARELVADRFSAGWCVYSPVDVDETDVMEFLQLPVGRSVFLVSDLGRIKEVSSSVPPELARRMFAAEETYVRRPVGEDPFAAEFWAEFERLSDAHGSVAEVTVVDDGLEDRAAALASGLITPIAQQLSLLGPAGWSRFEASFSSTVSAENGRLRFWTGEAGQEVYDVRVPEQLAVLVRRQRRLAALLPAGPWWRLLMLVDLSAPGNAGVITEYDYGDDRLPDDQLLAPDDYRRDVAAYPRASVPAWMRQYIDGGGKPNPAPAAPAAAPKPVALETRHDMNRLYADDQQIVFGRYSLDLDDIRWVRYPVVQVATKRFMFPTSYDTYFHFGIGTDSDSPKKLADIMFQRIRKNSKPPETWLFLVELIQRRVEPRLLAEFAEAVGLGRTVTIAGLDIGAEGISANGFALPWNQIGDTQAADGRIQVFRANATQPAFTVKLGDRNAVLLPALLAHLGR